MLYQEAFARAQIVAIHPILQESMNVRIQYFHYLQSLIEILKINSHEKNIDTVKWMDVNSQIDCYKEILCGRQDYEINSRFAYLLPVDLAIIFSLRRKYALHEMDIIPNFIDIARKISFDFNLESNDDIFLVTLFEAILSEATRNRVTLNLIQDARLAPFRNYLEKVRRNSLFIKKAPYKILVTATMSAGKSTLINAITGKNICAAQNLACTSKIHTIISKPFDDRLKSYFYEDSSYAQSADEQLKDDLSSWDAVSLFFNGTLQGQRLLFFDSPGVNSSMNEDHMKISRDMIASKKYNLLLYVLNATQLGTTDDEEHLKFIAEHIGDIKVIFIMNKADQLLSEETPIADVIARQREFLISKGFQDPMIYPVSARAAFLAKKSQSCQLTRSEQREFNNYVDKFEEMSLSTYYRENLGCDRFPISHDEAKDLIRDCGLIYLESRIMRLCKHKQKNERKKSPNKRKKRSKSKKKR